MNVEKEKLDLSVREIDVSLEDIFPKVKRDEIKNQFEKFKNANLHVTVFEVMMQLAGKEKPNYVSFLEEFGFYEKGYECFTGHCHQSTPVLGAVLKSLGFEVDYLECYKIKEDFPETGSIRQVPPSEETDLKLKKEFESIKRIPYCCLEIKVDNEKFYVSGKHLKNNEGKPEVVLSPVCYREKVGVFAHPQEQRKSGIYLDRVFSSIGGDSEKHIIWQKQTANKDPHPELFFSYLRMRLI